MWQQNLMKSEAETKVCQVMCRQFALQTSLSFDVPIFVGNSQNHCVIVQTYREHNATETEEVFCLAKQIKHILGGQARPGKGQRTS